MIHTVDVASRTAGERVRTGSAIKRIIARPAGNRIGFRIANAAEISGSFKGQSFEIVGKRVAIGRRPDFVRALANGLGDHVGRLVNTIEIIAESTSQRVASRTAVERVIARPAGNAVCTGIPESGEIAASGEGQILDIARKCIGRCSRHHRIGTAADTFDNRIAGLRDNIRVVPRPAAQRIVSTAARKRIVSAATRNTVVRGVASAREIADSDIGQVFNIVGKRITGRRRFDCIGSAAQRFNYNIRTCIDAVEVIARPARERIIAGAAIERIIARAARNAVVPAIA